MQDPELFMQETHTYYDIFSTIMPMKIKKNSCYCQHGSYACKVHLPSHSKWHIKHSKGVLYVHDMVTTVS